jgi:hypothetical protein
MTHFTHKRTQGSETSVANHLTPRNNPEDGRLDFNRGGSTKTQAAVRHQRTAVDTASDHWPYRQSTVRAQSNDSRLCVEATSCRLYPSLVSPLKFCSNSQLIVHSTCPTQPILLTLRPNNIWLEVQNISPFSLSSEQSSPGNMDVIFCHRTGKPLRISH